MSSLRSALSCCSLAGILLLTVCSKDILSSKKTVYVHPLQTLPRIYFSEIKNESHTELIVPDAISTTNKKSIDQHHVNLLNIPLSEALAQVTKVARSRNIEPFSLTELVRQSQMPTDPNHREYEVNLLVLNLCLDLYVINKTNYKEEFSLSNGKK